MIQCIVLYIWNYVNSNSAHQFYYILEWKLSKFLMKYHIAENGLNIVTYFKKVWKLKERFTNITVLFCTEAKYTTRVGCLLHWLYKDLLRTFKKSCLHTTRDIFPHQWCWFRPLCVVYMHLSNESLKWL